MKSTIIITGGSGFLGKRLGRRLSEKYEIVLGSRNNKQNFLAQKFSNCKTIPLDITNIESLRDAFNEFNPSIVIHAAATKFVDLAEKQPMECIDVNVLGSQNVARVAIEKKIDTVIGISTDKASPPVRNTYGLSKAIMERLFCSLDDKSTTRFTCVRYGNVAWSTGSVLPIWKKMFNETKVIGTTGPEMRRFFFNVDEAVELVISALENIEIVHGKVLSREMKSSKIKDMLDVWTESFGGDWKNISGRPGERTDEFLIGELELPYTEKIIFNDIIHYLISFNKLSSNPPTEIVSSANAKKLSKQEILQIISNPPIEEL
ncbi:MAG: polysaccharide biosynthesis protein [Ignavibacteriaceae bacterium]